MLYLHHGFVTEVELLLIAMSANFYLFENFLQWVARIKFTIILYKNEQTHKYRVY